MAINYHEIFREKTAQAGLPSELGEYLYNVSRDSEGHGWSEQLKDWIGSPDAVIALALTDPGKMSATCELLLATDGFGYMEGLKHLGITDRRRWELQHWMFGTDGEDHELTVYDAEPVFNAEKTALAIAILRKAALREDSGSGHVCGQFLKACEVKAEIDFADLGFLDTEDSCALLIVFQGMLFDPEKILPLLAASNP